MVDEKNHNTQDSSAAMTVAAEPTNDAHTEKKDLQQKTLDFGDASDQRGEPTTTQERIALNTFKLRRTVAILITVSFLFINGLVMYGLHEALLFDFKMLASGKIASYERFITGTVIASVLGATTIQMGAIMFAVANFLFPKKPEDS